MNKESGIVIFAIGMAIGIIGTWQYTKRKYEKIAEEEIASVKKVFSKNSSKDTSFKMEEAFNTFSQSADAASDAINDFTKIMKNEEYTNDYERDEEKLRMPYVISPDEFGEFDDYSRISLVYYSDGILAYEENDEIVEDVDEIIGNGSLRHFGEYEDDSVFVRNDKRKCEYEILMDHRKYSDVIHGRHRPVIDE